MPTNHIFMQELLIWNHQLQFQMGTGRESDTIENLCLNIWKEKWSLSWLVEENWVVLSFLRKYSSSCFKELEGYPTPLSLT